MHIGDHPAEPLIAALPSRSYPPPHSHLLAFSPSRAYYNAMKIFIASFITIFLAELGDKTQIATLLFAANKDHSKLTVFLGAASALILTSALGVLLGSTLSTLIDEKTLKIIGGVGFLLVGIWTIFSK